MIPVELGAGHRKGFEELKKLATALSKDSEEVHEVTIDVVVDSLVETGIHDDASGSPENIDEKIGARVVECFSDMVHDSEFGTDGFQRYHPR
jgi:hypothetical protein